MSCVTLKKKSKKIYKDSVLSETDKIFAQLRVLVVADCSNMREHLSTILKDFGIKNVTMAKCSDEGFEKLRARDPDIILVDSEMAPKSGFAFVKELRNLETQKLSALPIIMISGHRERELIERARDIGVTEYLAKPVTAASLHSRLIKTMSHPRAFIKSETFLGPDRRRRKQNAN